MILVNINNAYLWVSRLSGYIAAGRRLAAYITQVFSKFDSYPTACTKTYVDDRNR